MSHEIITQDEVNQCWVDWVMRVKGCLSQVLQEDSEYQAVWFDKI
jgi:hypothetical protein